MLGTLGGAIVALLIVLPGAAYTWGFEQAVSGWGAGLADRTLRFAAGSAVFAVITAPLTFWFYAEQVASGLWRTGSSGGRPGRYRSGTSSCPSSPDGSSGGRSSLAAGGRRCWSAPRPRHGRGITCS